MNTILALIVSAGAATATMDNWAPWPDYDDFFAISEMSCATSVENKVNKIIVLEAEIKIREKKGHHQIATMLRQQVNALNRQLNDYQKRCRKFSIGGKNTSTVTN